MKKRVLCLLCTCILLLSVNINNVFAARPGFAFNVYAYNTTSKWTDNMYGNSNPKTISGDPWTLILETLFFSEPICGVGMAFGMFRNNTLIDGPRWKTSTGTFYHSWNGSTEYYYNLKGRLDTDQPGYCVSNGIYNADVIS